MRALYFVSLTVALLLLIACTDDRAGQTPLAPTPSITPPIPPARAAISIASGNDQQAKAGEQLAEPFVVRVTDANGHGLGDVAVSFNVASGAGTLEGRCERGVPTMTASTRTNLEGLAQVTFEPTVAGRSTVAAQIAGSQAGSVTFTADATMLVIEFWFGIWNVGFIGPCPFSSDVTVPMGTTVEWTMPVQGGPRYETTFTVSSTATPQGGTSFDSGTLTPKDRFRYVPDVAGTWEYRDKISGLNGTLTAR